RVGVGWHGGHCFVCAPCKRGDFAMCVNRKVTGFDSDGGYAEYMIARAEALAAIADDLPAEEAGPFMCAGVTVYNALRNLGARGGQVVAVHGIGGLGHLGVQYARQMGFKTVALGRGKDKEPLAKKLGAHRYIDSDADDAVAELQKLGGARVILATAPNAKAISTLVDGLSTDGKLLVPAAPNEPLAVSMMPLIAGRRSVAGWYSGIAKSHACAMAADSLRRMLLAMNERDTGLERYLKEIGRIPLLTPEQEIELAGKIKKGDVAARERMILANLRLVVTIAHDYANL